MGTLNHATEDGERLVDVDGQLLVELGLEWWRIMRALCSNGPEHGGRGIAQADGAMSSSLG